LGNNAVTLGDHNSARLRRAEGLKIAWALDGSWGMAWAHMGLGHVAIHDNDYVAARDHFAQILALRCSLQDVWWDAHQQEEFAEACALHEAGRVIFQQLGHRGFLATVLRNLA
jgi:hypothetical protein